MLVVQLFAIVLVSSPSLWKCYLIVYDHITKTPKNSIQFQNLPACNSPYFATLNTSGLALGITWTTWQVPLSLLTPIPHPDHYHMQADVPAWLQPVPVHMPGHLWQWVPLFPSLILLCPLAQKQIPCWWGPCPDGSAIMLGCWHSPTGPWQAHWPQYIVLIPPVSS